MQLRARASNVGFAALVAVAIYWSYEGVGFDPAFPRGGSLGDFGSFYEMGRAAAHGMPVYAVYPLTYFGVPNINVPLTAVLVAPLSVLDPLVAARVWNIGAVVAYLVTVALLLWQYPHARAPWRLLWALGLSSLWGTLALGQIYTYLALLTTGAWLLLRRDRYITAGVLIGVVVALKPNFLVWPVILGLTGQRRAAISTLVVALALWLVPALLLPHVYEDWLAALRSTPQPTAGPTNGSLIGLVERFGMPEAVGLVLAALLLAGLALYAWRTRPPVEQASGAAIAGALLGFPLAWTGYSLFLLPIFFSRRWRIGLVCVATLLLVPIRFIIAAAPISPVLASVYTWAWLLVLSSQVGASFDMSEADGGLQAEKRGDTLGAGA